MNELDKPIGTKEQPRLTAGSVIVKSIKVELAKEGSKHKLVRFHCKHPDKEELIVLSNVMLKKVQGNNINIKRDAMWYNLDEDENIKKTSTLAVVLKFYNKNTLKEFENSSVNTELDASGYLAIKAY